MRSYHQQETFYDNFGQYLVSEADIFGFHNTSSKKIMMKNPVRASFARIIVALPIAALLILGISAATAQPRGQCHRILQTACEDTKRHAIQPCGEKHALYFGAIEHPQLRGRTNRIASDGKQRENRKFNRNARSSNKQISKTLSFGKSQKQKVDLYLQQSSTDAPLIVFVHGGAWRVGDRSHVQSKPAFFNRLGYAFASTGYRLYPEVEVEQQARDIAAAITILRKNADGLNYDGNNIILIGHSAGAHLAALLGTNPKYLGRNFAAVKGVILLDGASYDIPAKLTENGQSKRLHRFFEKIFSKNPERQRALSPTTYSKSPNVPYWLAIYDSGRRASEMQSKKLISLLKSAGARTMIRGISDTNHRELNQELGTGKLSIDTTIATFLKQIG